MYGILSLDIFIKYYKDLDGRPCTCRVHLFQLGFNKTSRKDFTEVTLDGLWCIAVSQLSAKTEMKSYKPIKVTLSY